MIHKHYYAAAQQEVDDGRLDEALWVKAQAEAGNPTQAYALYIRLRAGELAQEGLKDKARAAWVKGVRVWQGKQTTAARQGTNPLVVLLALGLTAMAVYGGYEAMMLDSRVAKAKVDAYAATVRPEPVAHAQPEASTDVVNPDHEPCPACKGTVADLTVTKQLEAAFHPGNGPYGDAVVATKTFSAWAPATGKAGTLVASDMLSVMDFASDRAGHSDNIVDNIYRLVMTTYAYPHIAIVRVPRDTHVRVHPNVDGDMVAKVKVVYDLQSGGHRYTTENIQATNLGFSFDEDSAAHLLIGAQTSEYMHIFVPIEGQATDQELLFDNTTLKALLPPQWRADMQTIEDADDRDAGKNKLGKP
ncbi:hypothetical protein [Dyella sp. Tek66A03]|uniref:hypothetical protein n=1 Tax=Dyella sp. Tek66A03 TaxID=3458298 RepID=UPI00403EE486